MERVTGAGQVGYFAAASRIPALLYAIPGCLGMAWYPQLFHAGSRDSTQHFALSTDQLKLKSRRKCSPVLRRAWPARAAASNKAPPPLQFRQR